MQIFINVFNIHNMYLETTAWLSTPPMYQLLIDMNNYKSNNVIVDGTLYSGYLS